MILLKIADPAIALCPAIKIFMCYVFYSNVSINIIIGKLYIP